MCPHAVRHDGRIDDNVNTPFLIESLVVHSACNVVVNGLIQQAVKIYTRDTCVYSEMH